MEQNHLIDAQNHFFLGRLTDGQLVNEKSAYQSIS
jgi:hypothetical protein